jgi:hypothetical protein
MAGGASAHPTRPRGTTVDVTEDDRMTTDQHDETPWVSVSNPRRVRL